jgi:hypothetical protein
MEFMDRLLWWSFGFSVGVLWVGSWLVVEKLYKASKNYLGSYKKE